MIRFPLSAEEALAAGLIVALVMLFAAVRAVRLNLEAPATPDPIGVWHDVEHLADGAIIARGQLDPDIDRALFKPGEFI